jgi:hypothetical protein
VGRGDINQGAEEFEVSTLTLRVFVGLDEAVGEDELEDLREAWAKHFERAAAELATSPPPELDLAGSALRVAWRVAP